jgi:hypothetical protein
MPRESDDEDDTFALGLVDGHRGFRLIAVHGHDVSGSTAMVLRAVRSLSGTSSSPEPDAFPEIVASIELWLEEERGRVITSPVTETPSPAHISILRALQGCLVAAPRWERSSAAVRIEAIRSLVLSARGIGAERALDAFARSGPLNLDALGPCLASRVRRSTAQPRQAGLVAVLCRSSTGCLAAYVRHNACDQFRAAGLPDEPSPLTW